MSIWGENFISSTGRAAGLMLSNARLSATVVFLSDCIELLGQLLIASCASLVTFVYIEATDTYLLGGEKYLNHKWFSVLLTFILAWLTSKITLGVYGIVIDALLMCILADDKSERDAKAAGKSFQRSESKRTMFKFKDEDKAGDESVMQVDRPSSSGSGDAKRLQAQL